jgi:hypothetical protein
MEFPSNQIPEALRQRVVARIPMYFKYGGQGTPEAGYSTLGAIARGVRTSTLRQFNTMPRSVAPGQVVEFFDEGRDGGGGRSVLAVVTGRERLDLTEPGIHERLSTKEQWTPAFLKSYLRPSAAWEQITYQPLVARAEGRVSPDYPFTEELIDSVISKAYTRGMPPEGAPSPQADTAGGRGRIKLTAPGPYTAKDQLKADQATKFIGRGSPFSSTTRYAEDFGALANTGAYGPDDVVFVSAEGNRQRRLDPDFEEINRALSAGATIVTDDPANRGRSYNIGERQVAEHLAANGYLESSPGRWTPAMERGAAGGTRAASPAVPTMEFDSAAVPVSGPTPSASQSPELPLRPLNGGLFSQLLRSGKLDGIKLPELTDELQEMVVFSGRNALKVLAVKDPWTEDRYTLRKLERYDIPADVFQEARKPPVNNVTQPSREVIESIRDDTPAAKPTAASEPVAEVPEIVQKAIVNPHPGLEEKVESIFSAGTDRGKKPTKEKTSKPVSSSSAPPPKNIPLDLGAARKLTRSAQVREVLENAERKIDELQGEIDTLQQARQSASTREAYDELTGQLDELRREYGELESRYTAARDTMETMVTREEYDKAVARHVAEAVTPDDQKLKANWQLAKRYGLPALAGVLGVAAGGMLFGDGDEVVVVDSGRGEGRQG